MKKLSLAVAIGLVCLIAVIQWGWLSTPTPNETGADQEATSVAGSDVDFARALADRAGDLELEGQGTVSKLLAIDIAPRVSALRVGDTVAFKGEYEWNAQGGIMHWTHHDPTGSHAAGRIRHDSRTYQ
ncbi:MAG: DUF3465 domain-containing protein [Actinobacteria bacterium]|nr:DUF3465 domain-containing protein [Actinomycetota bacterium]